MNWQSALIDLFHALASKAGALGATFGLGGGVGIVKLLNHWPAPYEGNAYGGAIFDTLQDLVSNKRIGERRSRDGASVAPVPRMDPIPDPKAAAGAPPVEAQPAAQETK
jgi:hypothetical protein